MAKNIRKAPEGAEAPKPEMEEHRIMFVGTAETTDGKAGFLWMLEEHFNKQMGILAMQSLAGLFTAPASKRPRVIGGVYKGRVVINEDRRITRMIVEPTWCDPAPASPVWAQVQVQMEALATVQRMRKLEATAGKLDRLDELMAPIRSVWLMTDNRGRAAIEAMVLNKLRGSYLGKV
jgi:hypothetical protein